MQLAHRCSALAPARVGASGGQDGLPWMQQGAAKLAHCAGAGGLRAGEDLLPRPLPLVRG
jgi:hypothetical protein